MSQCMFLESAALMLPGTLNLDLGGAALGWRRPGPPKKSDDARGLNPYPFHVANVVLHVFITCIVYRYRLDPTLALRGLVFHSAFAFDACASWC